MNKTDLKTGMIVTLRNGNKRVVVKDTPFGDGITNFNGKNIWKRLDAYTNDLRDVDGDTQYDVMKVEVPSTKCKMLTDFTALDTVWTRPADVRRMTMAEVMAQLGFAVQIVG